MAATAKPLHRQPSADEQAMAARARRIATEGAPPRHANQASWPEPVDELRTRTPVLVRGYRRGTSVLERLMRRGGAVTLAHVVAAHEFRCQVDQARLGFTGADPLVEAVTTAAGPSSGPCTSAMKQLAAGKAVARVVRHLGPKPLPLLQHVVLENRDIASFCAANANAAGKRPCAKVVQGRLLALLDQLDRLRGG